MGQQWIKYRSKNLFVHKAICAPDFNSPTVLTGDPWNYVSLWMRRHKHERSRFFWDQSRHFYDATSNLPPTSAPLTAYYSIMNATKALLYVKNVRAAPSHGVTGSSRAGRTSLSNEMVRFKNGGVHAGLRAYLSEAPPSNDVSLKDLLYNMPFVHRAFTLTYSDSELFIPIKHPRFVKKAGSSQAWFCADIQGGQYQNNHVINKLPTEFERDMGRPDSWTIRMKKRFKWRNGSQNLEGNLLRLTNYHAQVRNHVSYIHGATRLWYVKRSPVRGAMSYHDMTLIYAAMHRLSELARYSPDVLDKHFSGQHNWLMMEFISSALDQFIDDIASEITGQDFMVTGLRAQ
tara:strand:- start:72321 stop:73355 length:1035 start_codon:yes stop_codon:yes gene_type:complete